MYIDSNRIICGTGSDEVLIFSALSFCSPGDEIIHAKHGFEMYPIITKYVGAESVLATEDDYKINPSSIVDKINESTKLIFIANPNNPTSTYLNKNEVLKLPLPPKTYSPEKCFLIELFISSSSNFTVASNLVLFLLYE